MNRPEQVESIQFSEHGTSQPAVNSDMRSLSNQNNQQIVESPNRDGQDELTDDPEVQPLTKIGLAMLTSGLCLCTLVVSLDITILATPNITASFHSLDDVGWYGSAYLLMQTTMQPTFGRIYDSFNIKWTFLGGLMVFELGSVFCAVSTSSAMLIAGRAIAGVGAAQFSGGMNIISILIPLKSRAPYIALLSMMLGISSIAGSPLGGSITDRIGWRWCFWINVPCGVLASVIILLFLKTNIRHRRSTMTVLQRVAEIDLVGTTLLLCGITAFLLGIQWGGSRYAWSSARVWGSLLASGVCLAAFGFVEWKLGDRANIQARVFFQRTIISSSLFSCFLSMAFYIHVFYLPIYYQAVKAATPESSGFDVIPYQISNTIASLIAGIAVAFIGWYTPFIWIGSATFVVGSGLLYTITAGTNKTTLIGYQILTGAGFGASVQLPYIAAQVAAGRDDLSSANAIMIFFHSLGGTISLAIAQTLFLNNLVRGLSSHSPSIDPAVIIAAAPTNLTESVPGDVLPNVLRAYSMAVTQTFVFSIVAGAIAFLASLWLEWKDVRGLNMLGGGMISRRR